MMKCAGCGGRCEWRGNLEFGAYTVCLSCGQRDTSEREAIEDCPSCGQGFECDDGGEADEIFTCVVCGEVFCEHCQMQSGLCNECSEGL